MSIDTSVKGSGVNMSQRLQAYGVTACGKLDKKGQVFYNNICNKYQGKCSNGFAQVQFMALRRAIIKMYDCMTWIIYQINTAITPEQRFLQKYSSVIFFSKKVQQLKTIYKVR